MGSLHPHHHDDVDEWVDEVLDRLRADGRRITTGRRAIVRALRAGPDHHVTADDVAALVQADQPDVHLTTVYRTLDALERLGVLDRVDLGAGRAVYHLADHVHHHLICQSCGAVTEVPPVDLIALRNRLDERYGFEVGDLPVSLNGTCERCRSLRDTDR